MTEDRYELLLNVNRLHIKKSSYTGHANDPISIALRQVFGFNKYRTLVLWVDGWYMSHRRLTVVTFLGDSLKLEHSYELGINIQQIMWRWFRREKINPFKCRIVFTEHQIDKIKEQQRIFRLPPSGIDQLIKTTHEI